MFNKKRP